MRRPSSYDLAFRTMGNIEQVIIRDKDEVNALSRRIAKLNLKNRGEHRGAVVNGKQPRPAQPQSSAAAVAAAALNAERSALNLKQALLSARREPLLTAASLPTPPQPEPTPQPSLQSTLPFNGPVLPSLDIPDSTFAPGDASQLGSSGLRRTSHGSGRHLKAVSLKKSTSPAPAAAPAAPPTFQWGPLPAMNNAPRSTLAFNVRAPSSSPGRP
jgi:nucleoporin NUP159